MLKLNASFSKKVPAEQDYSSQSYHAAVEVELPDGLTPQQLQERIHATFSLVRDSVEAEIGGGARSLPAQAQQTSDGYPANGNGYSANGGAPQNSVGRANGNGHASANGRSGPASPKQVSYLLDLAAQSGADLPALLRKYGAASAQDLSRDACSKLIDEIGGRKR